jgi:hypothetical protein
MSIGAQPATRFKCLVQANGTAMGVDLRLNYVLDFRNQGATGLIMACFAMAPRYSPRRYIK